MKKIKALFATFVLAASFPTISSLASSEEPNEELPDYPDWYYTAEGRIDPNNPDLDNLPPSEVEIIIHDPGYGIGTRDYKPIAHGNAMTYLNRDGLKWYGTHGTAVDNVVVEFAVIGNLYRENVNKTVTLLDSDVDTETYSKGVVTVQTFGNAGTVGTNMIAEGIHSVYMGIIRDTVVTTEKKKSDAPY